MSTTADTAIVILTFNRWQDTHECLTQLLASDARAARIIVVDNGSTDETLQALAREFPHVHILRNAANLGYAEGNNVGLRYALANGFEFVVVLNNDVLVAPNWLAPLLQAAQDDPRAALLGPLVLHANEPQVIQSAGGVLPRDWHSYHRGANESDTGKYRGGPVDWLTGCAMLVRTRALSKIGLLDSSFFMYGEDVDWCITARQAGYHVLLVPQSRVWHKGVERLYTPAPHVTYYSARNELQLIRKHRGGNAALARAFARQLRTLASWTVRPRWRSRQAHRAALARALCDFSRGKTGQSNLG